MICSFNFAILHSLLSLMHCKEIFNLILLNTFGANRCSSEDDFEFSSKISNGGDFFYMIPFLMNFEQAE